MNDNFFTVLKGIAESYGVAVFSEPRRVSALLADLARDEPRARKNLFIKCLEYEAAETLKNVPESELDRCKQQLAQKLHDEDGLDLGLCGETIELLAVVILGEDSGQNKNLCANCGKELRDEWKTCPFCGTSVGSQEVPAPTPEVSVPAVPAILTQDNTVNAAGKCTNCSYFKNISMRCSYYDLPIHEAAKYNCVLGMSGSASVSPQSSPPVTAPAGNNDREKEQLREKLKSTKTGLTVVIVLAIIGLGIMGIAIFNINEDRYSARWQLQSLQSRYDTLDNSYKALQLDYDNAKAISRIIVTAIGVGNSASGGAWLNNPGDRLQASQMRYLSPVITYNSTVSEELTFYVKIINPNGSLSTGTSSPNGFSYSTTARVNRGDNQSLSLSSWGNNDRSTYQAGEYTVEVWYNNVQLRTTKVTINP